MTRQLAAVDLPLLGTVAAGEPIEAIAEEERIGLPEELLGTGRTYVLKVRGNSMIDEQIRDGDYVEILSGVELGERVVTRGAYLVKLAASGAAQAGHGHPH